MRLLDSTTLKLEEFHEEDAPPYAILSHTWGNDEVSYEEMLVPNAATLEKKGYAKITQFAALAGESGWKYLWVDTCCINKSSSAELSEAINSMYRWYTKAQICIVYLNDMSSLPKQKIQKRGHMDLVATDFQKCRWLTRGWALQELIAPTEVHFYSRDWKFLFTKGDTVVQLSMILGISQDVLLTGDPSTASVAQRMSWASKRETTRPEDIAYSLLGIFDVSMPLLYGEGGEKAFVRLQEEIMKSSDDHSLFAWTVSGSPWTSYRGLFAKSPRDFLRSRNAVPDHSLDELDRPFSVTNKGISISLPLMEHPEDPDDLDVVVGFLNCRDPGPEGERIGLFLKQLGSNQYARVDPHRLYGNILFNAPPTNRGTYYGNGLSARMKSFESGGAGTGVTYKDAPIRNSGKVASGIEDHTKPCSRNKPEVPDTSSRPSVSQLSSRFQAPNLRPSSEKDDVVKRREMQPKEHQLRSPSNGSSSEFSVPSKSRSSTAPVFRGASFSTPRSKTEQTLQGPSMTRLFVRQRIRLPPGHATPRVSGFVIMEYVFVRSLYLANVFPVPTWDPKLKMVRIGQTEPRQDAVLRYRSSDNLVRGMLAILLKWDRMSMKFSTSCVWDTTFSEEGRLPDEEEKGEEEFRCSEIMRRLEEQASGPKADCAIELRDGRQRCKVELELGMKGDEIVIKVSINIR